MHTESIEHWLHDHTFGQDRKGSAERRTLIVSIVTVLTMIVETAAGLAFGSMALLADGLHMGSHAAALAVSVFAYRFTRAHAGDARFNFGTGKVNSLAAFAGAMMLSLFALAMAWESVARFLSPVPIEFNQAILVAVLGLAVNGACLAILGGHGHSRHSSVRRGHKDHNLRSAYLHVLADALTSILAVFALLAAKYLGQQWLDPFMGLVGATLVLNWSRGLLRSSARVLLDLQAPDQVRETIRKSIESEGDNRISDLHVWSVGPGIYAAEVVVVSSRPLDPDSYYDLLPKDLGLVHATFETRLCAANASGAR
ncbi:MAG: CDF family Co(II)/Ni(II) efflux transporter DmeF [Deltaproteobacteria bacterium]|nr:CDF family Co(II)/Ni(II) efflux transporter DmeF [Deltaproteobacteria bacterium]